MTAPRIYLDYNATAPIRPAVIERVADVMARCGNASSVHNEGRAARAAIEDARGIVADTLNAPREGVIFTGGGTEANNLAIKGLLAQGTVDRVLLSGLEHPSIGQAALDAGAAVISIDASRDGIIDLAALDAALAEGDGRDLVCVMLANNETGALQPVAGAAETVHRHGALIHCDAVQAVGKIPVDFAALGVDLLSLSAHKLGGPQGVGALILREGLPVGAQISGGGQELRRRGGTENVAGIAGLATAIECARDGLDAFGALAERRDRIENRLKASGADVEVFAESVERLPNTSCFAVLGVPAELALITLDLDGIAVSSGSACSSGKVARSPVLDAMGIDARRAECALRLSLGWGSEAGDEEKFLDAFERLVARQVPAGAAA